MKNIFFSIIAIICFSNSTHAQKVFSVDYENQADVKVCVVKYENQADLKVFKVKYSNQVTQIEGKYSLSA